MSLDDEIEARIEAMAETGDVPPEERLETALDDIASLSAHEHGAYAEHEIKTWNAIRRAARERLKAHRERAAR